MRTKAAITILVVSSMATVAFAGMLNKVLSVGSPAPQWSNIEGTDGKQHSLADYKDAKAIVIVFTCNHCPVAASYEERLIALQKEYQQRGVQLVAICVSKGQEDDLAAMKTRAEEKAFNFPYLSDSSQAMGRNHGARTTPEVFVLDAKRKVAYMGKIDDNWMSVDDVKKPYLRDALDAVLAGRAPEIQETKAVGCGIDYQ
jgi:peroxiredoxin